MSHGPRGGVEGDEASGLPGGMDLRICVVCLEGSDGISQE